MKELQIIARYLNHTELNIHYINESLNEKSISKKLYFCAMNIEYVLCEKDQILLNEGEDADCFYIILKGNLKVLKLSESIQLLSGEEYLNNLNGININGFTDMINKTIEKNNGVFYVDKKDLPFLRYINFIVIYRYYLNTTINKNKFISLFYKYNINPSDFFLDLNLIDRNNYDKKNDYMAKALERIIMTFIGKHTIDYSVYSYVELEEYKRTMHLYDNIHTISLHSGRIIGDYSILNKTHIRY